MTGWFRNPVNSPFEGKVVEIPLFIGFYTSQVVVWDFSHQQYDWMGKFWGDFFRKAGDFECLWTFAFKDGTLCLVLLWRCGRSGPGVGGSV